MAPEVAELLPLPLRYRRPDGTWPSFSFYSALCSCTGPVTWFIYLYFLSQMSDSILRGKQFAKEVSAGLWCHSFLDFFLGPGEIWFLRLFIFLGIKTPELSFILGWATCFSKFLYCRVFWDWCSGGFHTLAAIKVSSFVPLDPRILPHPPKHTDDIIQITIQFLACPNGRFIGQQTAIAGPKIAKTEYEPGVIKSCLIH